MNRNLLYGAVAVLLVVVAVIGYQLYQEQNEPGLEIEVNDSGLSVETN